MANLSGRLLLLLIFQLSLSLVFGEITITSSPDKSSPATFTSGDDVTLTCSSTLANPTYSWTTTLTNGDGSSVNSDSDTITGTYLHGTNVGTHTCEAELNGETETATYEIALEGTTIWFSYPQPGDIVPNNVAIAVLTTVNEIRCYSPDTTSSSTLTSITTPSGPNSLSFTSSVAGKLVKSGGTSISDVNVGVYTCTYTNGDVSSEANFAVYSRDREGEIPLSITSVNYDITGTSMVITCTSTGWPATTITWTKDDTTLASSSTYSFSQSITDRANSTYDNKLTVTGSQLTDLLGDYTCSIETLRHNTEVIDSTVGSVFVESVGDLIMSVTTVEEPEIGNSYELNCTVSIDGATPTLTWKKGSTTLTNTSSITISDPVYNGGDSLSVFLTLSPLSQSHSGMYTCTATEGSNTGIVAKPITVTAPPPDVSFDKEYILATLGDPVSLVCNVTVPPVLSGIISAIIWTFGNSVVSSGVTTMLAQGVSTLNLGNIKTAQAGEYSCEARVVSTYVDVDDYLSTNITTNVTVQLPDPSLAIIQPQPVVTRYFSGSEQGFTCSTVVDVSSDPDATVTQNFRKGDTILQNGGRLTIGDTLGIPGSSVYTRHMSYDYLRLMDSDDYHCDTVIASDIVNDFVKTSASTGALTVIVEEPIPAVELSSTAVRFPNHNDYNDQTITCTATIGYGLELELEFDKMFKWTQGSNVLSATPPSDPEGKVSVSTLGIELTEVGSHEYQCEVSIQITGEDLIKNSTTLTVDVIGPANPNKPLELVSIDVQYNRATLQWNVSQLAYTPEQYVVWYGISPSSLTNSSGIVNSTMDYSSTDDQYTVSIHGLMFDTVYHYIVRATNTEGSTDSDSATFKTRERPPTAPPVNLTISSVTPRTLSFTWAPPPENHRNGLIVNYTLNCDETVGGVTMMVSNLSFPLTVLQNETVSLNLTGFRPGTPITCTVRATNMVGTSPPAEGEIITLEERPGEPPNDFMITYMSTTYFNLTWSPPSPPLQHGIITQYRVTCTEVILGTVPSSYPRVFPEAPYPSHVTVDDLRPSTDYTCTVVAVNGAGISDSTEDTSMTDDDVPYGPPNDFTMAPISSTILQLSWLPIDKLLQNGEIMNYSIGCNASMVPPMEVPVDAVKEDQMTAYSYNINGFRPGTVYQCTIYANTSIGAGPTAATTSRTLEERPSSPPVSISVHAINTSSLLVSWSPPSVPNGLITHYTVYVYIEACPSINSSTYNMIVPDSFQYVVSGLSPYQSVSVQVSASTAIGEGPRNEEPVTRRTYQEVPRELYNISIIPQSSSILDVTVPLEQDISIARGVISRYDAMVTRYGGGTRDLYHQYTILNATNDTYCMEDEGNITLHTFTFMGLEGQVPYNVSVNATNMAGTGSAEVMIMFTEEGIPPSPRNVSVKRINGTTIRVQWRPITLIEARGLITKYLITYTKDTRRDKRDDDEQTKEVDASMDHDYIRSLDEDFGYTVTVSAFTSQGGGEPSDSVDVPANTTATDDGETSSSVNVAAIVVPVVLALLLIIITVVIILIILVMRRGLYSVTMKSSDDEVNGYPMSSFAYTGSEKADLNGFTSSPEEIELTAKKADPSTTNLEDRLKPIPKSMFSQHVKYMHKDRDKGFELEYQSLTNPTIIPHTAAEHPANKSKNRFANIKPFDFSRVVLKTLDGVEGSDYINASYMDGYNRNDAYIAAQGPLPNTVVDFWRMIWEHKLDTIVMLTKCREGGKRKCEEYWPDNIHEEREYGLHITVTLTSKTPYADFEKKVFKIAKLDEPDVQPIELTHWHFLGWPDHGVPQYATSLISFIRHVRKHRSKHGPPILTHCSAGVGRTGTYILLDSMLERLTVEETLNVYEFLRQMRSKRVFMVQTSLQYVFIHDALDELITCGDTDITASSLKSKIDTLHKIMPGKGRSGFDYQFNLLNEVCRQPNDTDRSDALSEVNKQKNRYPDRVPYNVNRARLRPTGAPGADYINASFVDGYKLKNAYIATQGPMINTVHDFWRMIWEFKSRCIVQICDLEENDIEVCFQYWPTRIGEPMLFNKLTVTLQSEEKKLSYFVRKFEIKEDRLQQPSSLIVTQLQYTLWPEHSCPTEYTDLLVLLDDVNKVQRGTGNKPITVMCNDGMGRTGSFICIHAQQDRMKTEAVIDIFHYIKSIRIQRPGLVADSEQYVFCHQALTKFYGRFDSYSNFN